jgi:hypothetical protein
MAKRLLVTRDLGNGEFISFFSDGSFTRFNQAGQIIDQNDDPNPSLAAAIGAGYADEAAETAIKGSDEEARRFDADLDWKKEQNKNTYRVNLMNARTQQDVANARADYDRAQIDIAKQRLGFDQKRHEDEFGLSRERFGFDQKKWAEELGLNQARLGYDLIGTGAQLRGPENYFQAAEYARGVAGQPGTAGFLSALQNNAKLAGFGAQGGVPNPETLGTLQAKLLGGGDPNNANYLAQIGNVGALGAHRLGAGSLEQLTDTERKLFTSGLDEIGYDSNTFLDQYRRSRIGQGGGGYRAA